MTSFSIQTTVGEIIRAEPGRSRIFEKLGINYCCGGKKPLAEACQGKGIDPATVIAMLAAPDGKPDSVLTDPDTMSLTELCDHIEKVHHHYLREELPRLEVMTRKVTTVHGWQEPRLIEVRQVFLTFQAAMISHTQEEEAQIFPAIRQLESTKRVQAKEPSLKAALDKLESEHVRARAALVRIRILTDNHTPPAWACNTFRALYDGLAELETDTHQHVHKENNVLFPKALVAA